MYCILFKTKKTVELWRFVTIKACHYGLRHEFLYSWIWGGRELKSSTVTTRHITASQKQVEKKTKNPTVTFWSNELMKGVMSNFWEKKKGHIFLIFVIFHIRKMPCLLKPSLWTSASSYFDSVWFRQFKRYWHTLLLSILVIIFRKRCFFDNLNQVFFNRILAPAVGAKDGTLTLRAVTLAHPKRFFGNKS